tara:strand:+ start:11290 stop:12153 length:864 start_codon:yes stop_codon:yes gene_type:complete
MENKLEKLLYRKEVIEFTLNKYQNGAKINMELCDVIKDKITKDNYDSNYEYWKLKSELIEVEIKAKNYVTSYKNTLREYKDFIIPQIDEERKKLSNKDLDKIEESTQFKDYAETSKNLALYEIYGATTQTPANIEMPKIIDDIEKHLIILEEYKLECVKELKTNSEGYKGAKLRKEIFDTLNHIQTLRKRLNERKEYYLKTFLPKYEIELAEAKEKLDSYLDIAKEVAELNVDFRMKFLLDEYEKHKSEEENLWLFYTALKTRLKNVQEELLKSDTKPKIKLMSEVF